MEYTVYRRLSVIAHVRSRCAFYLSGVLAIVLVFAGVVHKVDAEVSIFLPDDLVVVEETYGVSTEEGQKMVKREHQWGNFQGIVPEGTEVHTITLKLGWSKISSVVPPEVASSSTQQPLEVESLTLPLATATSSEKIPSTVEEAIPQVLGEYVDENNPDVVHTEVLHEAEEQNEDSVPEETADINITEPPIEVISKDETFPWANAEITQTVSIPEEFYPVSETEEGTVLDAAAILDTKEIINEGALQVQYTLDGVLWHVLGEVDHSALSESTFDLSHLNLQDIPQLQIAIFYIISEGDSTAISFNTMKLEVGYTQLLVEEVLSVEEVVNDQEPNFKISSVKADVRSENIRAIIIEKGGILEFWYSVTNLGSGESQWNRLAGGSTIDADAPIAIKERTIFWLDRNQQTFFGFSVDTQSLTASSYEDPEDKIFLLPFENENEDSWRAVFDSVTNSLQFDRMRN